MCVGPGASDDGERVDIDRLAKELSNAARTRRALFLSPLAEREQDFDPDDFEVVHSLGYLSVTSALLQRSPMYQQKQMDGGDEEEMARVVNAFVARYFSGRPYQYPVMTFLKEYLPALRHLAEREFRALRNLTEIPHDKWEAASSTEGEWDGVPVMQLLGFFWGPEVMEDDSAPCMRGPHRSVWLVFKWEGLKPLSGYFTAEQSRPSSLWPWVKSKQQNIRARHTMIRTIIRGVVEAIVYCHEKGITHGSLGTGSVMMSTFDDFAADGLIVKLDNFGFSAVVPFPQGKENRQDGTSRGEKAVRNDIQAIGVLLMETVILALSGSSAAGLQRHLESVAFDVFYDNFEALRHHIRLYEEAVEFLNDRDEAGWTLLEHLHKGKALSDALSSPFFD